MNKQHIEPDRLNEYFDDRLSLSERRVIESHLDVCAICREELAGIERLSVRLDQLAEIPLPRDLSAAVLAEIERRDPVSQPLGLPLPVQWGLVIGQMALAFLLLLIAAPRFFQIVPLRLPELASISMTEIGALVGLALSDERLRIGEQVAAWLSGVVLSFERLFIAPPWPPGISLPEWGIVLALTALCWAAATYWALLQDRHDSFNHRGERHE